MPEHQNLQFFSGVLSGGQGTRCRSNTRPLRPCIFSADPWFAHRFVLADTEKLHDKLAEMSKRIRQLEDALQVAHAGRSTSPHPLLADHLLAVKRGIDAPDARAGNDEEKEVEEDIVGAFGTLTVTDSGSMRFLGASGSEVRGCAIPIKFVSHEALQQMLLMVDSLASLFSQIPIFYSQNEVEPQDVLSIDDRHAQLPTQMLTTEMAQISQSWPFTPLYLPKDEIQDLIESRLPSFERATALCEAYLENLSWFFRPVDRQQIMEDLIPLVYKRKRPTPAYTNAESPAPQETLQFDQRVDLHELALMLMVFACGAAGDLTLPPYNDEAELYMQLARTALGLQPVFEGASMSTIQTICMIGAYDVFSGRNNNLEACWKILTMGFSMSTSVSLVYRLEERHLTCAIVRLVCVSRASHRGLTFGSEHISFRSRPCPLAHGPAYSAASKEALLGGVFN